jgi:hypothetical protein
MFPFHDIFSSHNSVPLLLLILGTHSPLCNMKSSWSSRHIFRLWKDHVQEMFYKKESISKCRISGHIDKQGWVCVWGNNGFPGSDLGCWVRGSCQISEVTIRHQTVSFMSCDSPINSHKSCTADQSLWCEGKHGQVQSCGKPIFKLTSWVV